MVVADTVTGAVKSLVGSLWSEPKELTMAARWAENEEEKKAYERQLQQEERDARERKEREDTKRSWDEHFARQKADKSPSQSPPEVETRGRSSQSGNAERRNPSTTRRKGRSSKSPADMGEPSDRERVRQAVFKKALAT